MLSVRHPPIKLSIIIKKSLSLLLIIKKDFVVWDFLTNDVNEFSYLSEVKHCGSNIIRPLVFTFRTFLLYLPIPKYHQIRFKFNIWTVLKRHVLYDFIETFYWNENRDDKALKIFFLNDLKITKFVKDFLLFF